MERSPTIDAGPGWRETIERLERDGWTVTCRVGFLADAWRGGVHETAAAPSRQEALDKLWHLTLLDGVEGCP